MPRIVIVSASPLLADGVAAALRDTDAGAWPSATPTTTPMRGCCSTTA